MRGRCGFRRLLGLTEKSVKDTGHLFVGEAAESNERVSCIVVARVSRRSLFVRSHDAESQNLKLSQPARVGRMY